jgi:hypothetical protein
LTDVQAVCPTGMQPLKNAMAGKRIVLTGGCDLQDIGKVWFLHK